MILPIRAIIFVVSVIIIRSKVDKQILINLSTQYETKRLQQSKKKYIYPFELLKKASQSKGHWFTTLAASILHTTYDIEIHEQNLFTSNVFFFLNFVASLYHFRPSSPPPLENNRSRLEFG